MASTFLLTTIKCASALKLVSKIIQKFNFLKITLIFLDIVCHGDEGGGEFKLNLFVTLKSLKVCRF